MAQLRALRHHAYLLPAPIHCRGGGAPRCSGGSSYLDMWRRAMERERQSQVLRGAIASPTAERIEAVAARSKEEGFHRLLQVPPEERDRAQRLQVIDRATAAIAAARALLDEVPPTVEPDDPKEEVGVADGGLASERPWRNEFFLTKFELCNHVAPGPDFWSWSPPPVGESSSTSSDSPQPKRKRRPYLNVPLLLMEKGESPMEHLSIPFESTLSQSEHDPPLRLLQSLVEVTKAESLPTSTDELNMGEIFSRNAAEVAEALSMTDEDEASSHGMYSDGGSRWWKETGVDKRPDGVVCKWTLTRGVSADGTVEWEDKYWEAFDQFDYKELGSEKSGRDAAGNVWHEFWRESLWQDLQTGIVHIKKASDKWGKSNHGIEWGEKWWEHYNSSGQAEKWADKWCSIDCNTPLEAGHAHVWHEKWGENYDGKGGSVKYTDKWAERWEGDGWSKWGDKWDEHFNSYGHGVKQGETWWHGKYGDRWNRTWGEGHNGSGWIHKYGKSSSGEHWDTHVQEDTWYERYPHFGFDHCLQNSVQLQAVPSQLPS